MLWLTRCLCAQLNLFLAGVQLPPGRGQHGDLHRRRAPLREQQRRQEPARVGVRHPGAGGLLPDMTVSSGTPFAACCCHGRIFKRGVAATVPSGYINALECGWVGLQHTGAEKHALALL